MAARQPSLWRRVLSALGLWPLDPLAAAEAERHDAETRDRAKQERNDVRGPPIVGG